MEQASFIQTIINQLEIEFPDSLIDLNCPRNDGRHFNLSINSPIFQNLSRIERSRLVYSVLDEYIGTDQIHALSMKLTSSNDQPN
jgi:stress-induced morphogen